MRTVQFRFLPAPALLAFALLAMLLVSSACVYRMPIQQGNFLDKNQVDQLEPGMTRSQVMFLLGTPMVPDGFNADRWDYYYYAKYSRRTPPDTARVTVYFKDDKVDHVVKPEVPGAAPQPSVQEVEQKLDKALEAEKAKPAEQPPLPELPVRPAVPGQPQ